MTAFCAHPGCIVGLHAKNLSGVCKVHMHGPACRCAQCRSACRAPCKVKAGRARRVVVRHRIKTGVELVAEGLLFGPDAMPALPAPILTPPILKGSP